ncbi:MAG: S-methyl-5-thioribose-1-phosphate isomerase [Syntrophales bacterium]|nr:S-methyl-5-thioribose-1-phosphate isomerase [Syntrophales bacterium]
MEQEIRTIFWKDGAVVMIDQRALPLSETLVTCTGYREVIAAINDLTIRGAPAIGVAAAMGIALGALRIEADTPAQFRDAFLKLCGEFAASRPTARNLFWAIERMKRRFDSASSAITEMPTDCDTAADAGNANRRPGNAFPPPERCFLTDGAASRLFAAHRRSTITDKNPESIEAEKKDDPWQRIRDALVAEAVRICEEDIAVNRRLGANGRDLIPDDARILTHCNAGALATAGYGTALGVIRAAREAGKRLHVYIDETRPVLQGARLTAWEMMKEKIPCTLITDNMAGFLMQQRKIDLVIVGADRIAANGDTANKIGTYALAVLARAHGIPFYIAAPLSTIDPALSDGSAIPIEERKPEEVTHVGCVRTAPEGITVWNPAFDVTPHDLITAIITEVGVMRPPFTTEIKKLCS